MRFRILFRPQLFIWEYVIRTAVEFQKKKKPFKEKKSLCLGWKRLKLVQTDHNES